MAKLWNMRLSDDDRLKLESIAQARKMSKPEVIRGLLRQYHGVLVKKGEVQDVQGEKR